MRFMYRILRKPDKKGFTILELIVVLAIIGVLGALIVPWLMSNDGDIALARSNAKIFYYSTQKAVSEIKLSNGGFTSGNLLGSTPGGSDTEYVVYIRVPAGTNQNTADRCSGTVFIGDLDTYKLYDTSNVSSVYAATLDAHAFDEFNNWIIEIIDGLPTMEKDMYYYAVVDSSCRVVSAYCSEADIPHLLYPNADNTQPKTDFIFTYNGIVNEQVVGSYPLEDYMSSKGMFDMS